MDLAAADRHHIRERLMEQRGKFRLAPRYRRDADLTARRTSRRRVDAEHDQAMAIELGTHRRRRLIVGQLQLDCLEARRGRRTETLDEWPLSEQIGEVGGKAGHGEIVSQGVAGLAADIHPA